MDPLSGAIGRYLPAGPSETADLARVRVLLGEKDPWSRDLPLHLTASAVVVDPSRARVLLRWHPQLGRWLQVGGHADPGERDPWLVALREATEETGLTDLSAPVPSLERTIVQIVVVRVPASAREPEHEHADLRYVLSSTTPWAAVEESRDSPLRWLGFDEALADESEESFREMLVRARSAIES